MLGNLLEDKGFFFKKVFAALGYLSFALLFFFIGINNASAATHYIDSSLSDAVGTLGLCDGTADHYDIPSRSCVAGAGTKGFSTFEWAVESTRISQGDTVYVRGLFNDTASGSTPATLYATISIGNPTSNDNVIFESYDADSDGHVDADERAELRLNPGLNLRYFNAGATDPKLKFKSIDFTNPDGSTDYLFRLNVSTTTLYFEDCDFTGSNVSAVTATIHQLTAANVNLTVDKSEINDIGTLTRFTAPACCAEVHLR
ncbi:MAG: hypothetical protein WCT28_03690 [Patescibacteria group bacterium]